MDHAEMKSEGPWPAGWLWAVAAALVAAILSRWLGQAPMAAAVVLGLMVFIVYAVLLGQFWEEPASGDHGDGHGHNGHDAHGHDDHGHGDHGHAVSHSVAPAPAAPMMAAPVTPAPVVAAPVDVAPAPVEPAPTPAPVATPVAPSTGEPAMPAGLSSPRGGKADDLKQIEGIGPVLEKLCNELGIFHFDQIAGWGASEITWMDANLKGFKGRVSRDKWVAQARIIVTEGLEAFRVRAKSNDY